MPKVDQRRFNNQHQADLLDSAGAAAYLGVKARTLYAYASRGLLARVRVGQRSRYARADLERLKTRHDARAGHGPVAGAALRWGEPVLATRISAVDLGGPRYRGYAATDLARRGVPFPQVCQLLWTGVLEPPPAAPVARRAAGGRRVSGDPILRLMDVALTGLRRSSAPFGLQPARELERARTLLLAMAGAAGPRRPSRADSDPATRLLASYGRPATPMRRRLTDAALVLCADHELNASTFAARVAASTGADLQACLLAALAAFSGPRHGTASTEVEALVDEVGNPGRAEAVVRARTSRGQAMPGFGHRLYPGGDPRAVTMLALVGQRRPGRALATLRAIIRVTVRLRGEHPNIDAALVAVSLALRLPRGAASALFAVGRVAGWVAHVLEQRESPAVLRPRASYIGPAFAPEP